MKRTKITLNQFNAVMLGCQGYLKYENKPLHASCFDVSVLGLVYINKFLKVKSRLSGGAFHCVSRIKDKECIIGRLKDGKICSGAEGFHMWIETETHVIDFTSFSFSSMTDGIITNTAMQIDYNYLCSKENRENNNIYLNYLRDEDTTKLLLSHINEGHYSNVFNVLGPWIKKLESNNNLSMMCFTDAEGEKINLNPDGFKAKGFWNPRHH